MTYIYNDNDARQMTGTVQEGALLTSMNTHTHIHPHPTRNITTT